MSDRIDKTDEIIFAEVARGLAAVRRKAGLVAHCACLYCDEPLGTRDTCSAVLNAAMTTTRSLPQRCARAVLSECHF